MFLQVLGQQVSVSLLGEHRSFLFPPNGSIFQELLDPNHKCTSMMLVSFSQGRLKSKAILEILIY